MAKKIEYIEPGIEMFKFPFIWLSETQANTSKSHKRLVEHHENVLDNKHKDKSLHTN